LYQRQAPRAQLVLKAPLRESELAGDSPDEQHNTQKESGVRLGRTTSDAYQFTELQKAKKDPVMIAQELDLDYTASIEGICIPAAWVRAAVGLQLPAAAVLLSRLIDAEPADAILYARRCKAYALQGRWAAAVADLFQGAALCKPDP
jgi:hypothetical protein